LKVTMNLHNPVQSEGNKSSIPNVPLSKGRTKEAETLRRHKKKKNQNYKHIDKEAGAARAGGTVGTKASERGKKKARGESGGPVGEGGGRGSGIRNSETVLR